MDMLQSYIGKIKVAVHLNFMEGRCLSDPKQVYHLVDDQGIFHASFGKLLLADFLPGREEYRQQLYREICAQICKGIFAAWDASANRWACPLSYVAFSF